MSIQLAPFAMGQAYEWRESKRFSGPQARRRGRVAQSGDAMRRLYSADEARDQSVAFVSRELKGVRAVTDLRVQTRITGQSVPSVARPVVCRTATAAGE